jgi:hypothetical protein
VEGNCLLPSSLEVDVLDSEVVIRQSRAVIHRFVPCPSSPFIKHYVVHRVHTLCPWVKNAVGLRALCVDDEYPQSAPVVELTDVAKLLAEREAAEDSGQRPSTCAMPSLIRRTTIESLGGRAVEDADNRHDRLSPEDSRYFPLLAEDLSHPHNRLVAPHDDAVLLRVVRRGVVTLNTLIHAVRREFSHREFTTVVGVQHASDGVRSLSLAAKYPNPHVAEEVIDEQQEVVSSSGCSQCHRATQVLVLELEPVLG